MFRSLPFIVTCFVVLTFVLPSTASAANEDTDERRGPLRRLNDWGPLTCVKFDAFTSGFVINPGEALCASNSNGAKAQFGIRTTPGVPQIGYTTYDVVLYVNGVERFMGGVGQSDTGFPPIMTLQKDGNLMFDRRGFSQCIVLPGSHGMSNVLNLRVTTAGKAEMDITDKSNKVVWRLDSNKGCYPDTPNKCYKEIKKNSTRISWKEFVCSSDSKFRYGLDDTGRFGLWRDDNMVYRPAPNGNFWGWVRGDYFEFQPDGQLVVYRQSGTTKTVIYSTGCKDATATVLNITKTGDVNEYKKAGGVVFQVLGSKVPAGVVTDARDIYGTMTVCNAK